MNKHPKNNIKANLQHLILNKTSLSSHLPRNQPLIDIQRIALSKNHHHSYQKQLEEETSYLLEAIERHEIYYVQKMEMERVKYLNHFKIMHRTLEDECNAGLHHIKTCLEDMRQLFSCKKTNINSKKHHLERRQDITLQQKIQQLRRQTIFQVILFEVHLSDLTNFRQEIQKYTMSPWQKPFVNSIRSDQNECRVSTSGNSTQELRQEVILKEEGTQTESFTTSAEDEVPDDSEDDILCCQEELGSKISNTSRRRRRYAVGRRDVIKQQDESQQVSSLISESEVN